MAYATKYTIPFCSLQGIQYEVQVKVDGFTGTPVALTGSEHPFYTAEKNDKEWLQVPIRTQSGYIRIVCGESIWRDLIPTTATSHYVELIRIEDTSVQWRGFIKPETFTHSLYSGVDEYEFPIQCPLSILDGKFPEWDEDDSTPTFAALIVRLLSLGGVSFTDVYFPDNISDRYGDLLSIVNISQFYEAEKKWVVETKTISGSSVIVKYQTERMVGASNALEMLQAVCQFWGWELRERGTELWFTAFDEHTAYRKIAYSSLATITDSTQFTFVRQTAPDLLTAEYMTDRHEVELGLPAQNIEVNTDISAVNKVVDINLQEIAQFSSWPSWFELDNNIHTDECAMANYTFDNTFASGLYVTYTGFDGNDGYSRAACSNAGWGEYYHSVFRKYDTWNSSDDNTKTRYNFKETIFLSPCPTLNGTDRVARLTFETASSYVLENCAICIKANVKSNKNMRASSSVIPFYVRVGDLAYSTIGTPGWVAYDSVAAITSVPVGKNDDDTEWTKEGVIVNNFSYNTPYQGAEGFIIPITTPMSGKITIGVAVQQYGFENFSSHASDAQWHEFSDFGVSIVQSAHITGLMTTDGELTDAHTYKHENENQSSEGVSIDLKFCTYNQNKYGVAFVKSRDGGYMTSVAWENDTTERPEEHLLNRLSALYNIPTEWREIDIKDSALWVGCDRLLQDENGALMAPIAVARDWVDGIARLTLGKLPAWTPPSTYYLADCYSNPLADTNDNLLTAPGE